ncbi:PREDICTED: serine/threonine-protein kinase GRIK1 isoform X2 [Theobroma cacao]|uniref:non-specific serine/threonine protein kinase n=1 Tax=Theobroma cacao TaxID=3641 RepID=A0AB32WYJ0_THECC|nr:PREDICTED: serine/threonine-protein kinase GRIK1 isoform X2 [Theobroma cacao]
MKHIESGDMDNGVQRNAEDISNEQVWSRSLFAGRDRKQPITNMPRKNQTCKKIPVTETTSIKISKHVNGKKMINDFVKEQKISHGSYGKVVLYRNKNDGTPYAIKKICKSRLCKVRVTLSETAMTNVFREVSIMKMLDHPNIVNLVEVIDDPKSDYLYMVLEYVEGNGIRNLSEIQGHLDETTARGYFKDIIAGLTYLHSHNIIHGDIKPENLLLTRSGRVKIGDFSVSQAFEDDNDELWRCPGTPAFTPPECCFGTVYHGKAADIWATGVTLHHMVVGCYPFLADSLPETYNNIVNSPLLLPKELDPMLKDLLQDLFCKDPKLRITLDIVAEHPWVVKEGAMVLPRCPCCCRLGV